MPESCLLILVGALVGGIIFGTDHKSPPVMDSSIYFLYLLPPIVLEGGYFMPTRPFFENIGSILWWAVLGALINALGIGLSLYFICQVKAFGLGDVNLLQNLLFGSLISAVDPVAVLAVFEEARVNEQLYMMIFGEALLNDGITVVRCHVPAPASGEDEGSGWGWGPEAMERAPAWLRQQDRDELQPTRCGPSSGEFPWDLHCLHNGSLALLVIHKPARFSKEWERRKNVSFLS